ncbi:MAG: universal stress protein [Bacteroidota bacterium]
MESILIPIDFSADSINALEHAVVLANKSGSWLRMLHVMKSKHFQVPDYFRDIDKFYGNSVEDYFKILMKKFRAKVKTGIDYTIAEGKVYREICNLAIADNSSLIMMGTHGISGFEEFWVGSNAFRVVSNSPCPVITIRNGFLRKNIKKIILPIDITLETRQKVPFTVKLARIFNAEIHIVSVRESGASDIMKRLDEYVVQVSDYIQGKGIRCVKDALLGSNITEMTIEYAISVNAELISIMTEQVSSAKNIWMGNYAQQMVNHSPIPVLSFHPLND